MDIIVRGPFWGRVRPKKFERDLYNATEFLAEHLQIEDHPPDIDYHIIVTHSAASVKDADAEAICCPVYDPGDLFWEIEITINLRGSDYDAAILALCHEMVHAKQFASGQLTYDYSKIERDSHTACYIWNGRTYRKDNENQPWEKEAYGREAQLFKLLKSNQVIG